MSFTYPAATTSLKVFGRRWCSKLYLRSAWVSSLSTAVSSAPNASERAIAAGASAADLSGSAGAGADDEFSECLPQAVRRRTMADGRIRRGVMPATKSEFLKKTSRKASAQVRAASQPPVSDAMSRTCCPKVLLHHCRPDDRTGFGVRAHFAASKAIDKVPAHVDCQSAIEPIEHRRYSVAQTGSLLYRRLLTGYGCATTCTNFVNGPVRRPPCGEPAVLSYKLKRMLK